MAFLQAPGLGAGGDEKGGPVGQGGASAFVPTSLGGTFNPLDPSTLPGMGGASNPATASMGSGQKMDPLMAMYVAQTAGKPQPGSAEDPLLKRKEDPYRVAGGSTSQTTPGIAPPPPPSIYGNYGV